MNAAIPPFPETALRAVLAGCVAAWAREASGDDSGDEPRLLYVDAFAGAEFQFGAGTARGAEDETRAAAAMRALDSATEGSSANAIFAEEDPAHVQRVYADLERMVDGERMRATRDFASLAPGDVALVEADFRVVADEAGRFADGARTLLWMAPPTARKLPWEVLRPLVRRRDADVLLRFPHADFEKQSRHSGPLADLPGFARRIVEGCSALLGDAKHEWLPAWRSDARDGGSAAALEGVLGRFRRLLEGAAEGRIVKPLVLETMDGSPGYLYLVTSAPSLAEALDAAVRDAGLTDRAAAKDLPLSPEQRKPTPSPRPARKSATAPAQATEPDRSSESRTEAEVDTGPPAEAAPESDTSSATRAEPEPESPPVPAGEAVLDLFPEDAPASERPRVDVNALAGSIASKHPGQSVTWGDLQRRFAAADVTPDDLKRALAMLKRSGRAVYRTIKSDDDVIEFPAQPAPPAPRKHRRGDDDGGLFG